MISQLLKMSSREVPSGIRRTETTSVSSVLSVAIKKISVSTVISVANIKLSSVANYNEMV